MKTLILNYHNGNLTTAREQAKKVSHKAIRAGLIILLGYSHHKATLTADYLKTGKGFQEAADAK